MSEIVLYGVPGSPYVRSALLGLEEKEARYRLARLTIAACTGDQHLSRHPFGRIPVLDHGDFRLYETQAILRYLDAAFPGGTPLTPREPRALARMDQIVGIVDWYFYHQVTVPISAERLGRWGRPANEETVAKAVPDALICIRELARLKGGGPFMAGDALSIADLMLAPQLALFATTPESLILNETSLPDWLDRMASRDSWGATERDRLLQAA